MEKLKRFGCRQLCSLLDSGRNVFIRYNHYYSFEPGYRVYVDYEKVGYTTFSDLLKFDMKKVCAGYSYEDYSLRSKLEDR